jgi:hypothetical protein
MNTLCRRIEVEKDSKTFDELVRQLHHLLEKKHARLTPEHPEKASQTDPPELLAKNE